jgi:hypothetical protein
MHLFAQLTRRPRTNDAVLCGGNGWGVLDVGELRRWRCLRNRRGWRGGDGRLGDCFCGSRHSYRLGRRGRWWRLDLDDERCGLRRWRLGGSPLRGTLGRRGWLFGLDRPDQAVALGLSANAVRLCFLDRRGVAFHADAELDTEIECLFVREA